MDPTREYGLTALPRDLKVLLNGAKNNKDPVAVMVDDIHLPDTPLARKVVDYARNELQEQTFNHSMRVYYYGMWPTHALPEQFPDWIYSDETYLLACLLHDIGTTKKNIRATLMSFEFYGGILAHDLLYKENSAPREQADSVAEAIMRHQDIGDIGKITTVGLLIQLATIFDNIGGHADLVHPATITDVTAHYPRKGWSSCFASTIREEIGLKPWAHTTALGGEEFPKGVLNNKLMAPYD
ncbi:MAG: hypothetical protein M1840_001750 [Geoglossum simile]|nr:MAG: hypothetical protein M1840_001750 [Geoglossum simile]